METGDFNENVLSPEEIESELESLEDFRSGLGELIIKANQQYSGRRNPSGFKVPVDEIRRNYIEHLEPDQAFEEDLYSRFTAPEEDIDAVLKGINGNENVGPYILNQLIGITDSTRDAYDKMLQEL